LCDGPALGLVGVEERLRCCAGHHQRELPAKVVRVMNAAVHAVAFERGRGVGGIAREQDAADPIAAHHPSMGVEELRLVGFS
jgi:hypothetical protein